MVKKIFRSITTAILTLTLAILSPLSSVAFAATVHVTGTVTDQNGVPLSGITVLAKGIGGTSDVDTPVGTASNGTYDLPVPQGSYDILFGPPSPTSNLGPAIVRNVTVQSNQTVNARLTNVQHTFSGTVVDNNSNPIPTLQVKIGSSLSGQFYRAFTTSTGGFTITAPAGYYDYTNFGGLTNSVTLGGYPLASPSIGGLGAANNLTVETTNANITQNFTLNFVKLTITVKDSSGNPKSSQYVHTRFGGGTTIVDSSSTSYSLPNNGNNFGGFTGADGTYTAWINKGAVYPSGTICLDSSSSLQSCNVASNSVTVTASTDLNLLFQGSPPIQVVQPPAPVGLSAQSPTNQASSLTWSAVSGADHYDIYRDGNNKIGSSTTTSYSDTNVSEGSHSYYVEAVVNSTGMSSDPSNSVTVTYDVTAPTISYSVSQAANSNDWNKDDVTITFACNDSLSGIQNCPQPVTVSTDGLNQTVTGTATDKAGNTATATANVDLDKTAPSIAANLSQAPSTNGWNNEDLTVGFTCNDALSGIQSCSAPITVSGEGANQVVVGVATDNADNTASVPVTINLDQTNPDITYTVSQPANSDGWYNSDATVSFTCVDALSGVLSCQQPVTFGTEGINQTTTGAALDNANNSASVTTTAIKIDKTAPTLGTLAWSTNPLLQGQNTTISIPASDNLSGVKSVQYAVDNGTPQAMAYDATSNTWRATFGNNLAASTFNITVITTDYAGNVSIPVADVLAVYSPANGYVTGHAKTLPAASDTLPIALDMSNNPAKLVMGFTNVTAPTFGSFDINYIVKQNKDEFSLASTSISWVVVQDSTHASVLGHANLTTYVNGVRSVMQNVTVRFDVVLGTNGAPDHVTVKIFNPGVDPNSGTPAYVISDNVIANGSNLMIHP